MLSYCSITKFQNKCGCSFRISSSSSQVASSGLKCLHWTFTFPMALFRSIMTFLSRMPTGYTWNPPFGSTWITRQSTSWLGSCTYFYNNETWKTLCTFMLAGNANSYATSLILLKISNGPQNLAANFLQFPSLRELCLALTFRNTCSPIWNSLQFMFLSA